MMSSTGEGWNEEEGHIEIQEELNDEHLFKDKHEFETGRGL